MLEPDPAVQHSLLWVRSNAESAIKINVALETLCLKRTKRLGGFLKQAGEHAHISLSCCTRKIRLPESVPDRVIVDLEQRLRDRGGTRIRLNAPVSG